MAGLVENPGVLYSRDVRHVIRELRRQPVDTRSKKQLIIEWFDFHGARDEIADIVYRDRRGRYIKKSTDADALREWKRGIFEEIIGIRELSRTLG